LEVVVKLASYHPFDMKARAKRGMWRGQTHSTNIKQNVNNMHFGHISNYVNEGGNNVHLNGIPR
jgi:hypothetical protein